MATKFFLIFLFLQYNMRFPYFLEVKIFHQLKNVSSESICIKVRFAVENDSTIS